MVLLEGVFKATDNGHTMVERQHQAPADVGEALSSLVGHHVQFAMHQVPTFPFDPSQRGLGACYVEGKCPLGHDDGNFDLYAVTANGVLHQDPWRIEAFDGTVQPIEMGKMVGHMGRIAAASLTELEKLREAAAQLSTQIQAFSIGMKPVGDE